MSTSMQKKSLLDAVSSIRSAENLLLQTSRTVSDPMKLIQINTEYTHLDSYLSQILHAQVLSDDAEFDHATAALKEQASALEVDENSMKDIIGDINTATKIVGFVTEAIGIIAKL